MSRQNFKSSDEKITCLVQLDKRVEGVENFAVFLRVHISIMVKYTRILSTVYKVLHNPEKEFLNVEMNGISHRNEAKRLTVLNLFCQGPRLVRIMKKVENHVLHSHQWY